eukprot:12031730-Alexandrium_andersonii.AAC.1
MALTALPGTVQMLPGCATSRRCSMNARRKMASCVLRSGCLEPGSATPKCFAAVVASDFSWSRFL